MALGKVQFHKNLLNGSFNAVLTFAVGPYVCVCNTLGNSCYIRNSDSTEQGVGVHIRTSDEHLASLFIGVSVSKLFFDTIHLLLDFFTFYIKEYDDSDSLYLYFGLTDITESVSAQVFRLIREENGPGIFDRWHEQERYSYPSRYLGINDDT